MAEYEYRAVDGSRYTNKDAQVIGPVLADIAARHDGLILPPIVVEEAKPKKSPIHPYVYAENEKEAAYQWRLERARGMTRSVLIRVISRDNEGEGESRRAYVHVRSASVEGSDEMTRAYMPMQAALANDSYWQQVVGDARNALEYAARRLSRYESMDRFREVFGPAMTAIHEALQAADGG